MRLPPLAGAAEAAEILGVATPQITRLREDGRMPHTVAMLRATPVWLKADVQAMAKGRTKHPDRDQLPLLGLGEVAERLGVVKRQVTRWRDAGRFPKPDRQLRAGPIWTAPTIAEFENARAVAA